MSNNILAKAELKELGYDILMCEKCPVLKKYVWLVRSKDDLLIWGISEALTANTLKSDYHYQSVDDDIENIPYNKANTYIFGEMGIQSLTMGGLGVGALLRKLPYPMSVTAVEISPTIVKCYNEWQKYLPSEIRPSEIVISPLSDYLARDKVTATDAIYVDAYDDRLTLLFSKKDYKNALKHYKHIQLSLTYPELDTKWTNIPGSVVFSVTNPENPNEEFCMNTIVITEDLDKAASITHPYLKLLKVNKPS